VAGWVLKVTLPGQRALGIHAGQVSVESR
jgi:hypothetical protein